MEEVLERVNVVQPHDLEAEIRAFVAGTPGRVVPTTVVDQFPNVAAEDVRQAMRLLLQSGDLQIGSHASLSVKA
jgi:hypothetical protein